MKIDETVYNEYANWKLENEELLKNIKSNSDDIYYRFKHVLDVVDYYYDKLIDDENYSDEDDVIFKTGFYYIADQFENISELLQKVYNNDFKELDKHAKEVNLFLNTVDFQTEVLNNDITSDEDVKKLLEFDREIYSYISKKKNIPEEKYEELDDLTTKVFNKLNINYYSVNNIFLEIADELNIL